MPQEKTYENIYPTQWHAIRQAAKNYGIRIETAAGKTSSFGVTVQWSWNYQASSTAAPTLRIEILDAGLMTMDEALGFVDDMITGAIK